MNDTHQVLEAWLRFQALEIWLVSYSHGLCIQTAHQTELFVIHGAPSHIKNKKSISHLGRGKPHQVLGA
jgi:hypothetical protein